VAAIAGYFADGRTLQESAAAWPRLAALAADGGLQQFSCLHIATHAFADTRSGRLSGLALHDRDVWLDDLRELAPLPPLVVLSACNGGQSLVVGGDEQVGLLPTLLAVGARQVVSTLWQVEDEAASRFMADFYDRLAAGAAPAAALAAVQRAWWRQGERYADWAGFFSVGWI